MWQYDEFLKQHIEKARRLLAESDDLRGSTDLQMFLECFDANEQLHQLWLDASHQPRPGLTPQQKQQVEPSLWGAGFLCLEGMPDACGRHPPVVFGAPDFQRQRCTRVCFLPEAAY
jgi:hypothetical protein